MTTTVASYDQFVADSRAEGAVVDGIAVVLGGALAVTASVAQPAEFRVDAPGEGYSLKRSSFQGSASLL